jgi:hypothetical protein
MVRYRNQQAISSAAHQPLHEPSEDVARARARPTVECPTDADGLARAREVAVEIKTTRRIGQRGIRVEG